MKLIIDNRETDLISRMNFYTKNVPHFKTVEFSVEALDIGDVVYKNNEGEDKLVIERKSVSDLLASIKDGRYIEQSYRLNGLELSNHNILYLIEGDILTHFNLAVYSAMVSLNYHKGFSVIRTFSIDETAIFVCNTLIKLEKTNKPPFFSNDNNKEDTNDNSEIPSYCSVIKKTKKDNITPDNIGEIMLSQIPGISSVTSIAIMKQFKTIPDLITQITEDDSCLDNIHYETTNGQTRKINKASIDILRKYLLHK
jgi:ERCC4-type nuclease